MYLKTICINLKTNLFVKFIFFVHFFYCTYVHKQACTLLWISRTNYEYYICVAQQNTSKYVHVRVHVLSLKTILNMYKKLKSSKVNTCIGSWLLKKNIPQNEDDSILPRLILSFLSRGQWARARLLPYLLYEGIDQFGHCGIAIQGPQEEWRSGYLGKHKTML